MGNQQQYGRSMETFLLKYLPQLTYKMTINDTLLFYTILCTLDDEGPIICKLHFSKIEDDNFKFQENEINRIRSVFNIYKHPNILVYDKIFNVQKKAMLGIRQFVCHNLKEKLHRIPKLSTMEKKWLVFQLLCAVSQIHSEKMVHGDIKPSNIVLTSYNQLFITDQVPYKPVYVGADDLKSYNLYFGELDNNLRCYIAPERFQQGVIEPQFDSNEMDPEMDIFSAGCVIAEIFMDGHPLFDLAHLQNYKKKLYDPREDLQKKIKDHKIVDLIMSMIHRDPNKRAPINEYIIRWNKEVFPKVFSHVYFQVGSTFVRPQFLFSDMKISLIRKYINSIWFTCFGKRNATIIDNFSEPVEPFVFERIRDDTIKQFEAYLVPSNELFVFLSKQNLEAFQESMPQDYHVSQDDRDAIIVPVHWIGSLITSCYYPQSRLCGLEMLYKMAIESSIDIRLQFVLPYVLQMFEDENSKVKAKALEVAVLMFKDVLEQASLTTLTSTDYKVFDSYILPAFLKLKNESSKDQYVQHVFVTYLPLLAQIGHRFLELSIGSRFQKRQTANKNNMPSSFQQLVEENKESGVEEQDEDDMDRLFSQNENLLASTHHGSRGTIVIRDDQAHQEKPHKHHDAMEVFVNYDTEYDKLRRIILSIINDILSETEPTLQRIIYQNFGSLSVFFGRKMTIDNLIPLSNSCFNKKDFMLRMECLKGIPYLGLRVGQQTLAKFLLITCTQLLYDSEEAVVYEMVNALNKLLEFGLLSKADSLENLEKLLPFLLHPNTWIREGTMKYIKFLADSRNNLFSTAEVYCLIRPKLKKYLKKGEKVFKIDQDLVIDKLKPSLSRTIYETEIKGLGNVNKNQPSPYLEKITKEDEEAKEILKEVLQFAKIFHQSFRRERQQKDIENDYTDDFKRKKERTKTYRIMQATILAQLSGASFGAIINNPSASLMIGTNNQQTTLSQRRKRGNTDMEFSSDNVLLNELESLAFDFRDILNSQQEYLDMNFYPLVNIPEQDIEQVNYGLNKRILTNNNLMNFETDVILQALNIVPDDPDIPLISYKNLNLFANIGIQGLQIGTILDLEQSSNQPQQNPQFSKQSKTLPVTVNSSSGFYYQLGQMNSKFNNWRPSGRLITTLYEHKNPVNTLAITDDSQFFFTGSKLDNTVNVWMTKDIESDVTSHSFFSIKCKKQVNCITAIDNTNYFAVAGSQGTIDIYQMARVEQEQQTSLSERRNQTTLQTPKNPSLEKGPSSFQLIGQPEPNSTSIIKTIERKDEGDIILCSNIILPIQQQHLLAYVTQRGSLYLHDLRSRYDISSQFELFGSQKGLATCMTIGQDPYQMYFGTIGGYVMIYDLRYNVVAGTYKHFSRAPINSVASFTPSRINNLNLNRSDYNSPMALVSSGSANYELSLLNLYTSEVEVLLTVDDKKNKESVINSLPIVPSYYKESFIDLDNTLGKKSERNLSLFRRYLQSYRSSQHFMNLISYQQQSMIKNLDEEWLKHSKNRYMMVKSAYESSNACRKILVPRKSNSMLHNPETVSYAITGGNDRKIRYWDFSGLKKKSYYINSPNDDECQYQEESQGETLVVQEKVQQFKQFPQINSQLASKQFETGNQSNANYNFYANSTYYGILGGLMNGADAFNQDSGMSIAGGQGLRTSSFQADKVGDQEMVFNFNGLSEWQHFNGISMNQGCGVVGAADVSNGKIDYLYRDSQQVSHQDCILDMGMLEIVNQEPILITCGRDGLVKLWR